MAAESKQLTLGDELRSVARSRILRAARDVLRRQGFQSTVDDVATAAGVSRRTVFRHFSTQAELVAAAIGDLLEEFGRKVPGPPGAGTSVDDWLADSTLRLHRMHADLVGEMFWDIYRQRPDTAPEIAKVIAGLARLRKKWGAAFAMSAWKASGLADRPPDWVTQAITLQVSGFAYAGLSIIQRSTPEDTATIAAKTIKAVLAQAVSERR